MIDPIPADFAACAQRAMEENDRRHAAEKPQRVARYYAEQVPLFIENWPEAVHRLSVRSIWRPFPLERLRRVHEAETEQAFEEWCAGFAEGWIDPMRAEFGGDAFFRLGSRSPKDAWYGHPLVPKGDRGCTQPRGASSRDIAGTFVGSERVMEDSFDADDAQYSMQLVAREFIEGIEPHREFRCFMLGRKLVGISVYRAWEPLGFPEIQNDPEAWAGPIRAWFPSFASVSPMENVIFDVVVLPDRVVLLELNPFWRGTYPGHFSGKEFGGRFRFIGDGDSEAVQ